VAGDRDRRRAVLNCGWGQGPEESCIELLLGTGTRGELLEHINEISSSLHRAFLRVISLAHQLMHLHKSFYVKSLKISPTYFNPKIIFRELNCSLLK